MHASGIGVGDSTQQLGQAGLRAELQRLRLSQLLVPAAPRLRHRHCSSCSKRGPS